MSLNEKINMLVNLSIIEKTLQNAINDLKRILILPTINEYANI